jgi:hypothetical protein
VGVAGRLGQGLRINEAGLAHGLPLLPGRDCRTTCAKSLKLERGPLGVMLPWSDRALVRT